MRARGLISTAIALFASEVGAAQAGALTVSPVGLTFQPESRASVIEVANPSDTTATVQVRLFRWSQREDNNLYEATQDIGFSPAIFTLGPQERQVVRLVLRRPPAKSEEGAYRIFIDQLPLAEAKGVQTPVRMVVPAFVATVQPVRGALDWRIAPGPGSGEVVLIATNVGSGHVKLKDLAYTAEGERRLIAPGLSGYVLAGQRQSWRFRPPKGALTVTITADTDDDPITESLTLP